MSGVIEEVEEEVEVALDALDDADFDRILASLDALKQMAVDRDYWMSELGLEIARHHRDFATIRKLLDMVDKDPHQAYIVLAGIRNIVE